MSPQKYSLQAGARGVESASPYAEEALWGWNEDETHLDSHKSTMVVKVGEESFVRYSNEISGQIEHAYRLWRDGQGLSRVHVDLSGKITSTMTGTKANNAQTGASYMIDFEATVQRNNKTNFERKVHRVVVDVPIEVRGLLPPLPDEVEFSDEAECLLPVFTGQVIQVSKYDVKKEWLFGNVLYDPILSAAMEQQSSGSSNNNNNNTLMNDLIANALHDRPTSGWFPKSVTEPADMQVMQKLMNALGNEGLDSLEPPTDWNDDIQGLVEVPKGTIEYQETSDFFIASLHGVVDVTITKVERIQNLALYQTYAVKKQTLRNNRDNAVNNLGDFERRLFHGTTLEVIPKIAKQGFNRAFAGRNAVYFGRGVYFARDASYSCSSAYASTDTKGKQRIFICRVAVGDWCRGSNDQLTPDPKPQNQLELFDSTVDSVPNPSIFVVYHDAQAYPEYLIEFSKK
jgi:hypothetical protein